MARASTAARPPRLAGLVLLALAVAGCGGRYKPVPVSGVVTLDSAPVEGATVYFYAVGDERDGRPAQGVTDKNGEFRLSTMGENDGALPRNYKVVIVKYVPSRPKLKVPDFPDTPEGRDRRQDFMYKHYESKGIQPFKNALPEKYADSNSTPLTCNVTRRMSGVKFELTSK
jgi:hypothetical protein